MSGVCVEALPTCSSMTRASLIFPSGLSNVTTRFGERVAASAPGLLTADSPLLRVEKKYVARAPPRAAPAKTQNASRFESGTGQPPAKGSLPGISLLERAESSHTTHGPNAEAGMRADECGRHSSPRLFAFALRHFVEEATLRSRRFVLLEPVGCVARKLRACVVQAPMSLSTRRKESPGELYSRWPLSLAMR